MEKIYIFNKKYGLIIKKMPLLLIKGCLSSKLHFKVHNLLDTCVAKESQLIIISMLVSFYLISFKIGINSFKQLSFGFPNQTFI